MALKIFKKDIEPQCGLCEYGSVTQAGDSVVCRKAGGIMQPYSKCKKFRYDPLKREPKILSFNNDFSKEDFEL
ncbi:MAG: hypothetical protein E7533_06100 [Ruminococcaceae bacterium]|nr:hypothetical protein [Oscillospiraceae bacterium]